MNFRNSSETFVEVAKQYQQDMAIAGEYYDEQGLYARMHQNGISVDPRDFLPMIAIMGIKGDTVEERTADIHQKMDELAAAFENPDRSQRAKYLDPLFDLLDGFGDKFDPVTMDMDDPEQVGKLLQCLLIDQTIAVKKLENPEYVKKRYPTPESRNLMDARDLFRMAMSTSVMTNLLANNIKIDIKLSLPQPVLDNTRSIQDCQEKYAKSMMDLAIQTNGNLPKSTTFDLPILDEFVPCIGKNVEDMPYFPSAAKDKMFDYTTRFVETTLLQMGTKNIQGLKEAGIVNPREALYVDGQPFAAFVDEHFPNNDRSEILRANTVAACIFSGKYKLDVVHAYRNENGEMQYEAKTLRAAVTPEQEKLHLQQYSWLRRLFNWGPFRIETLQEKMDRIANDPNTEARHTSIIEDQKEKIETGIKKNAEIVQKRKLDVARNEARREAYRTEKTRLEETVAQWDKDSVIGILGQQITATYHVGSKQVAGVCDAIRTEIPNISPAKRYDKVAPMFAKVVLYSQLCNERAANGGQPGKIEKQLGEGNTEENIQNAVEQMANNPVFKALFLEKTASKNITPAYPDNTKFETMMGNGGCERFLQEYMQKLQAVTNQKAPEAPANEMEMAQQKEQEAPKAMV